MAADTFHFERSFQIFEVRRWLISAVGRRNRTAKQVFTHLRFQLDELEAESSSAGAAGYLIHRTILHLGGIDRSSLLGLTLRRQAFLANPSDFLVVELQFTDAVNQSVIIFHCHILCYLIGF